MDFFNCKTKIVSGSGAISALADLHIKRLFLVCDPFFKENGKAEQILSAAQNPQSVVFSQVKPDPSVRLAAEGALAVRNFSPDALVALGGGSAMDCAKAMACFSGVRPLLIAIPTTSGSGSEVTNFAILTHNGVKHPLVDDGIRPDMAILDDDLVTSLPPGLIADGGFDLISHALESYVATNANSFSDLFAQQAFCAAISHLQASFSGKTEVRGELHRAATMAGIAFSQSGLGLCHALSHSLGGEFHIPHGRLNAILLPHIIEINAAVGSRRYAALARLAGLSSGADATALRALKNAILRLRRSLRLPETLAQAGVDAAAVREKMPQLVAACLSDPCCATNPRTVDGAAVRQIILQVCGNE